MARPLRVLVVSPAYPPMVGGGEAYAARYANELALRGHDITVATSAATEQHHLWRGSSPQKAMPQPNGPRIVRAPIRPIPLGHHSLRAWRALMVRVSGLRGDRRAQLGRMSRLVPRMDISSALQAVGPVDLIHAYNISWEGPLVQAAQEAARRDVPLIVTPFMHLGVGANNTRDRVARNNTMQHQLDLLRSAHAVVALTSVEAQGLADLGISPARIHVLPAGIDPLPDNLMPSLQLDVPPTACFVGRNSRDKGVLDAITAIALLTQQGVNVRLELAGAMEAACRQAVAHLPESVRGRVHVHGLLAEPAKQAMLARSRFLLLPSRVDSFGIVIQEAWRQGVPVIGARAGGIPGLIRDHVDGLLVPYGDPQALANAMASLLADPTRAAAMGAAGRDRLPTEFSWPMLADRLEAIYQNVRA